MKTLYLAVAIVLFGCASAPPIKQDPSYYLQRDVKDVTKDWGEPTRITNVSPDISEYQFADDAGYTHRFNPKTHEMESTPNGCATVFTVNSDGVVASYRTFGMTCLDAPPPTPQ